MLLESVVTNCREYVSSLPTYGPIPSGGPMTVSVNSASIEECASGTFQNGFRFDVRTVRHIP